MTPTGRTALLRLGLVVGALASLGSTFTLGVIAGAGSTPQPASQPASQPALPPPGVLDEAADQIAGQALRSVDRDDLDAAAIRGMLAAVGDPWGSWSQAGQAGSAYAGVGLWIRPDGSLLRVAQVVAGSPAAAAGVEVGDALRAVADRSVAGRRLADVVSALRGQTGTGVRVVMLRGAGLRTVTLRREPVGAPTVTSSMVDANVGRIVVPAFEAGTGRAVREQLRALVAQHATGIVLDLRGDPGGLLSEAVEVASVFLRGGEVVTYTRRDGGPQRLVADGHGDTSTRLVVLVDGGTASAAEVVAGALQDRDRAVLVGARTFGKGSVQEPHLLPDGSRLALTVARYTLPSGRSVEGVGLEPDIDVEGARGVEGDDPAVRRAVVVLSGLLAAAPSGRG